MSDIHFTRVQTSHVLEVSPIWRSYLLQWQVWITCDVIFPSDKKTITILFFDCRGKPLGITRIHMEYYASIFELINIKLFVFGPNSGNTKLCSFISPELLPLLISRMTFIQFYVLITVIKLKALQNTRRMCLHLSLTFQNYKLSISCELIDV